MPQDLIDEIEIDLNPFDVGMTNDVDMLESRMTKAINLFERILEEIFN